MKRIFSFVLSVLMIASLVLMSYAEEKEDGLYLLMESTRSETKLILKVYMYNNPGLSTTRFQVCHNPEAVTPVLYENGDIWSVNDYFDTHNLVNIDPANDYFTVYTGPTDLNTNEGLYFTAVYDIRDDEADAGICIKIEKKNFVADLGIHGTIEYMPQVINNVENSHNWTFDRVIKEVDIGESGAEAYVCEICGREKIVEIPSAPAWKKGDLDNSGDVGTKDAFLMKKHMAGYVPGEWEKWFLDAADLNGDGSVNEIDMNLLHRIIMGRINN